ncbi:MAG: hypothetical protein K2X27_08860, partial [Candidatus Obscuribacterales bacterium]|nr:hypothetical protein [Candidatus Obscuribacterales bacterium]
PSALARLQSDELRSANARNALERLPWYKRTLLEAKNSKAKASSRRLEIDFSPLSIKSSRDNSGIDVDVQGSVKIYNNESNKAAEEKFLFSYLLKENKSKRLMLEDMLDNQSIGAYQLD